MRVCIEGLMGSGKSTFCEYVGDYVPEPVLGGTGIGFIRELRYLLARKRNWRSFGSSGGDTYYYYDRSLWSSGVFWLPEYSYGHLSYDELDLLHSTKEAILRDADLPDVVVWFRASVLTCARRLGERGDFDADTDIEYLCRLESSYVSVFDSLKALGVPVIEVDVNEDLYGEARKDMYTQIVRDVRLACQQKVVGKIKTYV